MEHNDQSLQELRHSCAHLLAAAVMELYPHAKHTIGPAIEHGFYYDFDFGDANVSDDDLPKIEQKMREIVKKWDGFAKKVVTKKQALESFADNPYKKELIEEFSKEDKELTFYVSGNFVDLCRGGHTDNPSKLLKHFKLLSIAGAYWRGDEHNTMLTRIYGTCFPTKEALDAHLVRLEEAKKRDHRKLGADLDLFVFSDLVGRGLPLFTPKGSVIRRELERFITDEEIKRGYLHVYSPELAKVDLYRTSGHYPYYKDTMYAPITIEDEEYMLRPMTCPHHFELFRSRPRSYRELPMRIAELAKLYRFEKSGELTGLMRVRSFCLADAHIIAKVDQAENELLAVLELIDFVSSTMGLKPEEDYWYRLSLGDRANDKKYFKDDASWETAEAILKNVLVKRGSPFREAKDEAAFYGPKIDVQIRNVNGKEDTAFTVQYDFVMPKRFNLRYTDTDGTEKEPVVIHRSSIGAIERTMAFLIEKYGGAFPLWLAPVQVAIIPIAERHLEAATNAVRMLTDAGIRAEIDAKSGSMQAKIRNATLQKVPYMGIIGDKEAGNGSISVRKRNGEDLKALGLEIFLSRLKHEIESKSDSL